MLFGKSIYASMNAQETISPAQPYLSKEAFENLAGWFENFPAFREEIVTLVKAREWEELEDAFYTRIQVGTGGIRGRMGAGPNRINERTISEAAQALSEFIIAFGKEKMRRGVVVGYEARRHSKEFALLSCRIFAANGIRCHLFDGIRATPEVSFAVRHLKTAAGVQITASHNPRTDNGFKFYWSDGGQVVPPLDARFMRLVSRVRDIQIIDETTARDKGFITTIGKELDEAYLARVRQISLIPSRSARIAYSPLHGAGSANILPVLRECDFEVHVVAKQAEPDENFPTAKGDLINPEYPEIMEHSLALAKNINADIALTSDPDADRVAVAAKKRRSSRTLHCLNGNEVGVLLTHFILSRLQERKKLHAKNLIITTYVTTSLISDIAKNFGVRSVDNLPVGFKFIANTIENLKNNDDFVFAAEESLGYLYGNFVRDKDGAIASLLVAEAASWLKDQGKTPFQYLDEIYQEYGYYRNTLFTLEMRGKKGFLKKKTIMRYLRSRPPEYLAGMPVLRIRDELPPQRAKAENYQVGSCTDQLTFVLSKDERARVTVRPSGTEPKLKYYVQHFEKVERDNLTKTKKSVDRKAGELMRSIIAYQKQPVKKA